MAPSVPNVHEALVRQGNIPGAGTSKELGDFLQVEVMITPQQWVLDNLDRDASVEALARRANMSTRNFTRTFHREAGMTPAEFVHRARLDAARRLLEESPASLKSIAREAGFFKL